MRSLIYSGMIVCDTETCVWQVEGEISGIPETLYGVLRSRIDQLPRGAQHILQLSSVIGRIFSYRVLAQIAERRALDRYLIILQREQLIRERSRIPEAEYIFQHQLTLEVVYDGLPDRVRRVLHRRVAQALEHIYEKRIEEQEGRLGYHWEQSGEKKKASRYLRIAGENAAARYANQEALNYLSRALNLVPSNDFASQYDLLRMREDVYDRLSMREAQRSDLQRLQDIADVMNDGENQALRMLAEVALRKTNYFDHTSNRADLAGAAQKAIHLAQLAGDKNIEAEGYLHLGYGIPIP